MKVFITGIVGLRKNFFGLLFWIFTFIILLVMIPILFFLGVVAVLIGFGYFLKRVLVGGSGDDMRGYV